MHDMGDVVRKPGYDEGEQRTMAQTSMCIRSSLNSACVNPSLENVIAKPDPCRVSLYPASIQSRANIGPTAKRH